METKYNNLIFRMNLWGTHSLCRLTVYKPSQATMLHSIRDSTYDLYSNVKSFITKNLCKRNNLQFSCFEVLINDNFWAVCCWSLQYQFIHNSIDIKICIIGLRKGKGHVNFGDIESQFICFHPIFLLLPFPLILPFWSLSNSYDEILLVSSA